MRTNAFTTKNDLYDYKKEKEAVARRFAKSNNDYLLRFAKTKFKIGDIGLVDGRTKARIVKVHPKGYITVPGSYACYSMRWLEPITCNTNIYQYVWLEGSRGIGSCDGQTTEDKIEFLGEI